MTIRQVLYWFGVWWTGVAMVASGTIIGHMFWNAWVDRQFNDLDDNDGT